MQRLLVLSILFIVILSGCDSKPDTCKEQSAWQFRIGFKKVSVANNNVKTVKDSAIRSFIALYMYKNLLDTNILSKSLPLAQASDTSIFLFNLNGKGIDTLCVIYKRERIFENYTCGFRTNFIIDTVYTKPIICDSIVIVQPNITDVYQENCRFYLNNDSTKYH
jgi:hypothetical protein